MPIAPDLISSVRFPALDQQTHLNHAGVAPICGAAADALTGYARHAAAHGYVGGGWYGRVQRLKSRVAELIGAQGPDEIAYIPNTSTGLATLAESVDWRPGDEVVITAVEYPANRYPWEHLQRKGVTLVEVPEQPDGRIRVQDVVDAVTPRTRVVSLSMVQFTSGFRIEVKPISDAVHAVGGLMCVDGIQAVGVMPVDVQAMGVDWLAADGHKWLLGPEGCGFLYVKRELCPELIPPIVGWMNMVDALNYDTYRFEFQPDARRFEPGTYNIPGILAMGASVEMLLDVGIDAVWERVEMLTDRLCDGLTRKGYPVFSPRGEGERSGIVSFPAPGGRDPRPIEQALAAQGFVLALRGGRLRASPHFYNSESQIDALIGALPTP